MNDDDVVDSFKKEMKETKEGSEYEVIDVQEDDYSKTKKKKKIK